MFKYRVDKISQPQILCHTINFKLKIIYYKSILYIFITIIFNKLYYALKNNFKLLFQSDFFCEFKTRIEKLIVDIFVSIKKVSISHMRFRNFLF